MVGVSGGTIGVSAEGTGSFTFIYRGTSAPVVPEKRYVTCHRYLVAYNFFCLFWVGHLLHFTVLLTVDGLKVKMCRIDADYCNFVKLLAFS